LLLALAALWLFRKKEDPKSKKLPFEKTEVPGDTKEYFPLFPDLSKIDWDFLRIKRAF